MNMIDTAARQLDAGDLVLLANVETIRDQMQPATPSAVASLVGGLPVREAARRLYRMAHLGLLGSPGTERGHYALTPMGAELLARELVGWTPSTREHQLRDAQLRSASAGAFRSN